jgi:hypothetical protein
MQKARPDAGQSRGYFWSEVSVGNLVMAAHDGTIVSQGNSVELTAFRPGTATLKWLQTPLCR